MTGEYTTLHEGVYRPFRITGSLEKSSLRGPHNHADHKLEAVIAVHHAWMQDNQRIVDGNFRAEPVTRSEGWFNRDSKFFAGASPAWIFEGEFFPAVSSIDDDGLWKLLISLADFLGTNLGLSSVTINFDARTIVRGVQYVTAPD